jgi:poly-beta-1,6-N-acetyl-D-glucosamine synthase
MVILNSIMLNVLIVVLFIIILYVYVIYFLLLGGLARLSKRRVAPSGAALPAVTLIIPAYNEISVIRAKLENSLAIDYPRDLLEIVVASDGSDDGTEDVVKKYVDRGVVLRAYRPRAGKTSVLNRTIPQARGAIVVLCDANVMFEPDAIDRMAGHFADPQVGAVTGDVQIRSEDAPFGEGEGLYYKYERFIQLQESILGSTVTVDGGMYAIRKHLFQPLAEDTILDDFVIGMKIALSGHRVMYDPSALASENATIDVGQEFRRKVRIVAGAARELLRGGVVPSPRRFQLFWSFLSHKLLRWLVPWFLLAFFLCSVLRASRDGWTLSTTILLVPQIVFYICALIGTTRPNARWPAVIGVPFYFCMVNAAACIGSLRGLWGAERVTWKKATR